MKKPNLFILGAPKCGTTALATWLSSRPDVFVSSAKEPHYFSEDHRLTHSLESYEGLFEQADASKWVCEASVWYLFSNSAVPSILAYEPDARFIVMVRNPVDMAVSLHEQHRFNGSELVADFGEALALNDARARGEQIGVRAGYTPPAHLAYYVSCALGWQIARLYERVPRDRVHVIVLDDLAAHPERTYDELLRFLDVPRFAPDAFDKINPAKRRKSVLVDSIVLSLADLKARMGVNQKFGLLSLVRRRNVTYHSRAPLDPELRCEMTEKFKPDSALLSRLLGRDLDSWRDN